MIRNQIHLLEKVTPWLAIGSSGAIVATQRIDFGAATTFVGAAGLAVLGFFFEFRRRKTEADKFESVARIETINLEATAKTEAIKLEALAKAEAAKIESNSLADRERVIIEAKAAREKVILEAQILLDQTREKAYKGTLTEEISTLKALIIQGNKRTEDANCKAHEIINANNAAQLEARMERDDLKNELIELRKENQKLLNLLSSLNVKESKIAENLKENSEVTKENTDEMKKP